LAISLVCAAGCGGTSAPDPTSAAKTERKAPVETAGLVQITVNVKNMTKALNIT